MSKKDEPKKLGKNGVDMGDRGVYDKRNTLMSPKWQDLS